jgi:hypothetical protein
MGYMREVNGAPPQELDIRLIEVLKRIEESRQILVRLASAKYEAESGKSKQEIRSEIAAMTQVFKHHLKSKHFLKGESFEELSNGPS